MKLKPEKMYPLPIIYILSSCAFYNANYTDINDILVSKSISVKLAFNIHSKLWNVRYNFNAKVLNKWSLQKQPNQKT